MSEESLAQEREAITAATGESAIVRGVRCERDHGGDRRLAGGFGWWACRGCGQYYQMDRVTAMLACYREECGAVADRVDRLVARVSDLISAGRVVDAKRLLDKASGATGELLEGLSAE